MLVYDITAEKSFENIKTWIRNIEQHASDDVEKMILGNKCDMEDKRVVTKDQGSKVGFLRSLTVLQSSMRTFAASIRVWRDVQRDQCKGEH